MGCTHEWGQLLSRYVDDEATMDERAQAEEHLSGCATCRDLLGLFRRNESVLDNSLAGEVFGSQLVDSVMAELRASELPPVIAPEVRGSALSRAWGRVAVHGWKIAAAASIAVAIFSVLSRPDGREELRDLVARLSKENETLAQAVDQVREIGQATNAEIIDRMSEMDRDLRTAKAALQAPVDQTFGVVHPRRSIEVGIRVRDMALFQSFDLERSEHGDGVWEPIASRLALPFFEDTKAKPGVSYDYRFIGRRRDGAPDDTMPPVVKLRIAAGDFSDPETHVDVHFIAATPSRDQATFRLIRWIDGAEHSHIVSVRPGEAIGERAKIDGREVDFSTGLVLDRLTEGDQVVSFSVGDRQQAFSRLNARADLKRLGGAPGHTLQVWKGSSTWVPAAK